MDETLFYVFGLTLVVSALGVAFVGLRFEAFPPTRLVLAGVIAYFACLVGATTTFAVLNARDQQHAREAEQAAATTTEAANTTTTTSGTTSPAGAPQGNAKQGGTTVKLAAESDAIAFDTKQLSAKAGQVTIAFDNPSGLTHDVCLEDAGGNEVGCSDTISQSQTSLSEDLKPGDYTFYCSVDAHRATGMEGTLTVK
jgi:plastocyanin